MVTWSCLSFLARAGRLRAIAMTTAAACGDGKSGRSLEMSRLPFLTDMIITHCSSLTLMKRKRQRAECGLGHRRPTSGDDSFRLPSDLLTYLSSHSFSCRELHSCTVLALCCSSRVSRSSSGAWTKRFSKSWTSSSKLYIWRTGGVGGGQRDTMRVTVMHPGTGGYFWCNICSTCQPSYLLHGVKDLAPPVPNLLLSFLLEETQKT